MIVAVYPFDPLPRCRRVPQARALAHLACHRQSPLPSSTTYMFIVNSDTELATPPARGIRRSKTKSVRT